ncbi:MAG: PD-(D/E)XK nuclease domain-containing protein, partial [Myxococcota bacterium]
KSGQSGVVMELKVVQQPQALLEGVVDALQQLEAKHYETLLEAQQVSQIHRYGLAFNGKEVRVAELSQRSELEQALAHARAQAREQALEQAREKAARRKRQNTPATPTPSVLSLEERLELDGKLLPLLTPELVSVLWLRLGFKLKELNPGGLLLLWEQLFCQSEQTGNHASLGTLLGHFFPTLQDEPLLQKLRGKYTHP